MLTLSEIQSKLNTIEGKKNIIHKRQILLIKTEARKLSHQDGITQPGIKTLSMDIVVIVLDLVINK
jgi:hypothetical protein